MRAHRTPSFGKTAVLKGPAPAVIIHRIYYIVSLLFSQELIPIFIRHFQKFHNFLRVTQKKSPRIGGAILVRLLLFYARGPMTALMRRTPAEEDSSFLMVKP